MALTGASCCCCSCLSPCCGSARSRSRERGQWQKGCLAFSLLASRSRDVLMKPWSRGVGAVKHAAAVCIHELPPPSPAPVPRMGLSSCVLSQDGDGMLSAPRVGELYIHCGSQLFHPLLCLPSPSFLVLQLQLKIGLEIFSSLQYFLSPDQ